MKNKGLLLDTHVWLWLFSAENKLSEAVINTIEKSKYENGVFACMFSVWEIAMLQKKDRLSLGMPVAQWVQASLTETPLQLINMTPEIAIESVQLPGNFHGDPADRIITATARIENLILVTHDTKIIDYSKMNYLEVLYS